MGLFDGVLKSVLPLAAGAIPGLGQAANVLGGGGVMGPVGPPPGGNVLGSGGPIEMSSNTLGGQMSARAGESPAEGAGPKRFPGLRKAAGHVNEALGTGAGRLATDVGQQFLGDARQARNKKQHFEFLEGKGLNPFEAAGMGGGQAGSVSPSSQASAPSSVSTKHPSQKMAAIAGRKEWFETELIASQMEKIQADSALVKLNAAWLVPFKFAGMGMENMKAALATFNSDVDISQVLRAAGDATPAQRAAGQELLETFLMISGSSGGAIGWIEWMHYLERTAKMNGVQESVGKDIKFMKDVFNPGGLPRAMMNRGKN